MAGEAEVGAQIIGGPHSQTMGKVKAGIKADTRQIDNLTSSFSKLKKELKEVRSELTAIAKAKVGGGGGSGSSYLPPGPTAPAGAGKPGGGGGGGAGGGGGGLGGALGGYLPTSIIRMGIAGQFISGATGAIDNRIDQNMAYSLPADRLSLVQQQMTGLTQNQVANQIRKPLMDYKLGMGGANTLLTNQTRYGIDAGSQAKGYEALRAVSGYSLSTADLVGMQNQLTSPQVANRLFNMTGGFNFNKAGGGAADLFTSFKQLSKMQGLSDPNILKGAFQQGSFTRANLSNLGIDSPTQDLLLQYAQENQTFKKMGGKGDYDPSNKDHRKLMGTETNFATQSEETDRLRGVREENMYRRQADNYASLEKSNQSLIKALGSLEDTMSGLIGARASSRPWQKAIGGGLQAAGLAGMAFGGPVGWGVGGAAFLLGSALGDPVPASGQGATQSRVSGGSDSSRDASIQVPNGYGKGTVPLTQVKQMPTFKQMNANMQDRLLRMMRENPTIGVGQGFRSSKEQETLFRSRYRPTSEKTGIFWQGQYWEHVSGAPAAPPGKSMHETGLAADLVGDLGLLQTIASKYGLKTFAGVNNEPWHVQPAELPNSRSEYEKAGASWGTGGAGAADSETTFGSSPAGGKPISTSSDSNEHPSAMGGGGPLNFAGQSIQDVLNTILAQRPKGYGGPTKVKASGKNRGTSAANRGTAASKSGKGGPLTGEQIAQLAWNAGFRGQDLINVVAISKRESNWNPGAYNPNAKTKDLSFGLMQINMLGDLGAANRERFGITANEQLYDPQTNMNAAFKLYQASGNQLTPWGGYKGKSNTYNTDLTGAAQVVKAAGLGDPMPVSLGARPQSGGGHSTSQQVTVHSTPKIEMPMNFTFHGVPNNTDIRQLAQNVKSILVQELQMDEMRTL